MILIPCRNHSIRNGSFVLMLSFYCNCLTKHLSFFRLVSGCGCSRDRPDCHGGGDRLRNGSTDIWTSGQWCPLSSLVRFFPRLCLRRLNSGYFLQLRYGEPVLRRAVPLALALISVSNPRLNILDTLSKFSHDADPEVSHNSIFAMGMVGSGEFL